MAGCAEFEGGGRYLRPLLERGLEEVFDWGLVMEGYK
jgi:hypothetical protein